MGRSCRVAVIFAVVLMLVLRASHGLAAVSTPADFIRSSCQQTLYPELCEERLSGYVGTVLPSPQLLARLAITLTAKQATVALKFVMNISRSTHRLPVYHCHSKLTESVDGLHQSATEVSQIEPCGSQSFPWHLAEAKSMLRVVLTNLNTCLNGLEQDWSVARIRPLIEQQVVSVLQQTTNDIALLDQVQPCN